MELSICPSCGQPADGATCASCGGSLVLEERFRLEQELGAGTWGITYRARDSRSNELVVVKRIDLSRARDPKQLQLVDRECAVLAQLHHPRIPRYVTHFRIGKGLAARLFLVQAYVDGKNLEQVLAEHRYTEAEILDLVDELLAILEYLHGLTPPVIHRDVKPQNVIRESATGAHWLLDFGAVREHVAGELGGSTVAGTFGYMAPEQFAGDATPASDLYALGALAIRLATRVEPNRLLDHANRLVWRKRSGLGDAAAAFLDRLVEPDSARRIATAREARATLAALRSGKASIVVRPDAKRWTADSARSGLGPVWQVRSAATGDVVDFALGDLWSERRSGLFDQADEVRVADGPWIPFERIPDLEAHAVEVYGPEGREIFRGARYARSGGTWDGEYRETHFLLRAPSPKRWKATPVRRDRGPVWQVRSAATGKVAEFALGDLWAERRSNVFDQADEVRVADGAWVPFGQVPDLEAHAVEVYGPEGREIFRAARAAREGGTTAFMLVLLVVSVLLVGVAVWMGATGSSQEPATRPPIVSPKSGLHYAPATPMQTIESMMHNNPRLKQCVADSGVIDLEGIVVRFVPEPDGTGTSDISLSPAELRGSALEGCVAGVIGQMHFPSYDGEPVELTYQLER